MIRINVNVKLLHVYFSDEEKNIKNHKNVKPWHFDCSLSEKVAKESYIFKGFGIKSLNVLSQKNYSIFLPKK